MKFIKAEPLMTPVNLPDIYTNYRERYLKLKEKEGNEVLINELETSFANTLMEHTLDNVAIELKDHESLWIVMHGEWVINLSKCCKVNKFNLSGFLKLIGGLPKFTYFVILNENRTDSITIRMYPTKLGVVALHNGKEYSPTNVLEIDI